MSASGVNRKILHIDDDPQLTRVVGHMLQRKGYEVVALNTPEAALGEIIQHGYRVILLEIDMPRIDGIELLRRIKEYDGAIQVIMLTGLVTLSHAMAAFRCGAEACFFKPVEDLSPLTAAIDASFHKIEHWWKALHDLTMQRRHAEACTHGVCSVNA